MNNFDKYSYRDLYTSLKEEGFLKLNNRIGALILTVELCVYVGIVTAVLFVEPFSAIYCILQALLGLAVYRCFVLVHESGHDSLFRSRPLNRWVAEIFGAIAWVPAQCWRDVHQQHHKWVGIVDKDPTSAGVLKMKPSSRLIRKCYRFFWISHIPIAALTGILIFWKLPFSNGAELTSRKRRKRQILSVFLVALFQLLLLFMLGIETYLFMFGPAMLIYLVIFECVNLCHHAGLYRLNSEMRAKNIPCYEQSEYCRTTVMPSWLSAVLCYHFTLHTEHHLFPSIPWYRLPSVRARLSAISLPKYQTIEFIPFWWQTRTQDPFEQFIDSVPSLKAGLEGDRETAF